MASVKLIAFAVVAVLIVGVTVALYMVAQSMEPPAQPIEEVIPDATFAE